MRKASSVNSPALDEGKGDGRASGDYPLTLPEGKGRGRENNNDPRALPKLNYLFLNKRKKSGKNRGPRRNL